MLTQIEQRLPGADQVVAGDNGMVPLVDDESSKGNEEWGKECRRFHDWGSAFFSTAIASLCRC